MPVALSSIISSFRNYFAYFIMGDLFSVFYQETFFNPNTSIQSFRTFLKIHKQWVSGFVREYGNEVI